MSKITQEVADNAKAWVMEISHEVSDMSDPGSMMALIDALVEEPEAEELPVPVIPVDSTHKHGIKPPYRAVLCPICGSATSLSLSCECGHIFLLDTATPIPTEPQQLPAIPWRKGDWAFYGPLRVVVQLSERHGERKKAVWYTHPSTNLNVLETQLSIPTPEQLRVKIGTKWRSHLSHTSDDGEEVYAWAWEYSDSADYVYVAYSDEYPAKMSMVKRNLIKKAGIPIVTADQVNRPPEEGGFGGIFPPEG